MKIVLDKGHVVWYIISNPINKHRYEASIYHGCPGGGILRRLHGRYQCPCCQRTAQRKPSQPAAKSATIKPAAAGPIDDLSKYIGTNDFYLALVREGVKKG
jgi:hypothetical protein